MKKRVPLVALALIASATLAVAQEKPEAPAPRKAVVPLKVQLVLSKLQGDKTVGSLPYTLTCNADDRSAHHLRMGIEVPVLISSGREDAPSYQYRSVGTNIDCRSAALDDGRFRLELTVEHSSIYSAPQDAARPLFRTFRSGFAPILRDGQTQQYTVATDPVTGEVVKVEVGLSVLK